MGTILISSLGNTIMKVIILLCAVVAAVSANAVPNTCQVKQNLIGKLGKEVAKHHPPGIKGDGVCEDGEGFDCIGEVTSAIATCVLQGHFDGAALFECICWAMFYLGYNCPEYL